MTILSSSRVFIQMLIVINIMYIYSEIYDTAILDKLQIFFELLRVRDKFGTLVGSMR